jgi:predicted RNA-binding protein Jag
MSEAAMTLPSVSAPQSSASPERKAQVEAMVSGILERMGYPTRLELKDMPDGGIGVALHFTEDDLPGIVPGKPRAWLVDCIQFLVNKAINRPQVEKRWVSLGVNSFPEPRPPKSDVTAPLMTGSLMTGSPPESMNGKPSKAAPATDKPAKQPAGRASKGTARESKRDAKHERLPQPDAAPDEKLPDVKPDPAFAKLVATMAEKSARSGRLYAVMSLSSEDRARALKACQAVKGVSVKVEGEGHWRRLTFTPATIKEMPSKKQVMPDYDED